MDNPNFYATALKQVLVELKLDGRLYGSARSALDLVLVEHRSKIITLEMWLGKIFGLWYSLN